MNVNWILEIVKFIRCKNINVIMEESIPALSKYTTKSLLDQL